MNKFSPVTGGHPLKLDDLMLMQSAYLSGFMGLVDALSPTGSCILKGVKVTTSGSTVTYTDGFVAIAGEVFVVTGSSFPLSSNPSDILYFNPVESPVPPDPTTYQDTSIKNVHLQRVAVLKYKAVGDSLGVEYFKSLRTDAGDIRDWINPQGTAVTDFFDTTGLGINIKEGWAICNGLNGTPDLRGFFTAMATNVPASGAGGLSGLLSGTTNSLADQIGQGKITLTQGNLPNYNLPITDNGHIHSEKFSNYINISDSGSGTNIPTLGTNGAPPITLNDISQLNTTGITVSTGGSSVPIENRPPTFYVYKIMKVN
jgi:hypothetical protein